ncbi:hypothetical protein V5P93_004557 [Actinokineospora auranticolor]|uniref:Uncharacterized protein n=1 Tax=Actinokineospora auranticolor TaxID=155976 RepID=A0A2S6GT38_9PSEU|nr:hypothetical protein [Actinokineospora auranticolor]PPK68337.1 hypothetical protein CLV40_10560 [Actinokineospora auranticolor]
MSELDRWTGVANPRRTRLVNIRTEQQEGAGEHTGLTASVANGTDQAENQPPRHQVG